MHPDTPKSLRSEIEEICFRDGRYPQEWEHHTSCPCCGTSGSIFPAFEKYGFRHDRCGNCGFVCLNPYPDEAVLKALYEGDYYTLTRELYELPRMLKEGGYTALSAPKPVLEGIISSAAKTDSGAWLDVGGGVGAFGGLIRETLPGWEVSMNEYNPRSNEIARDNFGLTVVPPDTVKLAAMGARYDVISAIAVLEHVVDPLRFVEAYSGLLKRGGRMVLLVPNFTTMSAKVAEGSSAIVAPPYHLSLFNRDTLRRLLDRSGLFAQVDLTEAGPAAFSVSQVLDYGDYWDISMPTVEQPARSLLVRDYPHDFSVALNVLSDADSKLGDYFAETDGRVFLTAIATLGGR